MEFSLIQDTAGWDALAPEWNALFAQSYAQVPFLRYGYLRSWWQTLGGGEWDPAQSQLALITAREQGRFDWHCSAVFLGQAKIRAGVAFSGFS